jgi:hypothetical protein
MAQIDWAVVIPNDGSPRPAVAFAMTVIENPLESRFVAASALAGGIGSAARLARLAYAGFGYLAGRPAILACGGELWALVHHFTPAAIHCTACTGSRVTILRCGGTVRMRWGVRLQLIRFQSVPLLVVGGCQVDCAN